jgi:hypothetical protein
LNIQFVGDGSLTSSKNFTTTTLENLAPSQSYIDIEQNEDLIQTDGGIVVAYKKGKRRRKVVIKLVLLTEAFVRLLLDFEETIDGSTNWFTYQDETVGLKTALTHTGAASTTILQTTSLATANFPLGVFTQWAILLTSASGIAGQRRQFVDFATNAAIVSPAFTATVQPNDTFLVGIPVFLTGPIRYQRIPPSFYEVTFQLTEKGD